MCGRFTCFLSAELLSQLYRVQVEPGSVPPRYNIAPSQPVLIVRELPDGSRQAAWVHWGLIPSWSKDPSVGGSLINARSETAAEKPSFRSAFRRRRCLIPASGFYEWQKKEGKSKQPWFITSDDGRPLSFAGLWEQWHSPDGSDIETCAILTTSPNERMEPIHHRMPVILAPESFRAWLSPESCPDELQGLLVPFPSERMKCYPVRTLVNRPGNDSPELLIPLKEPDKGEDNQ